MDSDDLQPLRRNDALIEVTRQDLDPLSLDELQARIEALQSEITRVQEKIKHAVNQKASAEALFKR
jgi:uncharacterized small protein (DUF1192 family)